MNYPQIDPVFMQIGPLAIRWYALAYIVGIIAAWGLMRRLVKQRLSGYATTEQLDDFITWLVTGIILGGRLGYVLFYDPARYLANPGGILRIWQGGMSFHGGLVGVIVASLIFARRQRLNWLCLADLMSVTAPLGLALGRLANFINGELYGRVTTSKLGMVFPGGGDLPRHPSQLYEMALEGVLLFVVLQVLAWRSTAFKRPGLLSGLFLSLYALVRLSVEPFRQPDPQLGFLLGSLTMGMLLSLPMLVAGLLLIRHALRRRTS